MVHWRSDLAVMQLVMTKKGEQEIPGFAQAPLRSCSSGPKSTTLDVLSFSLGRTYLAHEIHFGCVTFSVDNIPNVFYEGQGKKRSQIWACDIFYRFGEISFFVLEMFGSCI